MRHRRWVDSVLVIQVLLAVEQINGLRFTVEPVDQVVALGSPLWWDCVATDTQTVSYSWSRNGNPLPIHGNIVIHSNGTLHIRKISADNVGQYICRVDTLYGLFLNSREASLQLAYIDPSFTLNPQAQTVLLGDTVNLTCKIESLPIAVITWLLNGEIVTLGEAVQDEEGESTLMLTPVMYYGAGEYKCKATNPLLQVYRYSLGAELVVRGTPVFLASLEDVSVPEGFNASFHCFFHGNPEPQLTWFLHTTADDGQVSASEISNSDKYSVNPNGTLTIYDVTYADQAFYTCSVGNIFGVMSESAALNVTGKAATPVFTVKPGNITVIMGDNVTVQCAASGNPEPYITWFKGDATIQGNGNIDQESGQLTFTRIPSIQSGWYSCMAGDATIQGNGNIIQDNGQLTITRIQSIQSGWYSCMAENDVGSVNASFYINVQGWYSCIAENDVGSVKTSFYINVQVIPSIDVISVDTTCLLGSQLVLNCVGKGNPTPIIMWSTPQYGDIYSSSSIPGVILHYNGTLVVSACSNKDGGLYTCMARSAIGYEQKSVAVSIESLPEFTIIPVSQSVNKGGIVYFHCQSSGVPSPTITWTKHGEGAIASSKDRQIYLNNTLVLRNVDQLDAGIYKCTASNKHNTILSVATLTVTVPPTFITRPEDKTVYLGDNIELVCQTIGDPVPTQSWRKDGRLLSTGDNLYITSDGSRLTIDNIIESQFGAYTCVATNMAGSVTATAVINQYDVPVITVKPRNSTVNQSDTVTIQCKGDAKTDQPTIEWYRKIAGQLEKLQGDRVTVSMDGDLTLQNVMPSDEGWYSCVVSNSAGTASAEMFLDVHVLPRIIHTNSPQTTLHQSSVILTCQSSADPPPTIEWINPIGDKISPSSAYLIGKDSLQIVSANQNTDDGDWICQSCNYVGCVDAVIQLHVDGLPVIELFTGQKTGNIIKLECQVKGQPSPSVTFRSQGQIVTSNMAGHTVQNNVLNIVEKDVKPPYTCATSNKYGTDTVTLAVPEKADVPTISKIGPTWVMLEWTHTSKDGDLPVTFYKVQISTNNGRTWQDFTAKDLVSSTMLNMSDLMPQDFTAKDSVMSTEVNVTSLMPYKQYNFRVTAGNILGVGEYSDMSLVTTSLAAAPSAPTNLVAIEIDDGVVLFSWSPPQFMNGEREDVAYIYTVTKDGSDSFTRSDTIYYNGTLQVEVQDMTSPGVYVFSVQAVNMKIGQTSDAIALTVDLGVTASQTQTQLTGPNKIIIILAGVFGGILVICIIIFIALRIRRRKKTETLSFLKPRLSLDQFYMENTKQIYRTESRLSMRSRSRHSFYSFTNDDSFHGKSGSVRDVNNRQIYRTESRLSMRSRSRHSFYSFTNDDSFHGKSGSVRDVNESSSKRKSDCDVLLVARNPLYTDNNVSYSAQSSRVNTPEPLLDHTEESFLQHEIELPTTSLLPESSSKKNTANDTESELETVQKKPLTPLSARNLEDDINAIYNSMNASDKHEAEIPLEHVYASIHSDGQSSRSTGDLSLSSDKHPSQSNHPKPPSQSNQPKPPIRVLSPDKLRYSPPGFAIATKTPSSVSIATERSSRSVSPGYSRSKSTVKKEIPNSKSVEELNESKHSENAISCEKKSVGNYNNEENLTSMKNASIEPSTDISSQESDTENDCDKSVENENRNVEKLSNGEAITEYSSSMDETESETGSNTQTNIDNDSNVDGVCDDLLNIDQVDNESDMLSCDRIEEKLIVDDGVVIQRGKPKRTPPSKIDDNFLTDEQIKGEVALAELY